MKTIRMLSYFVILSASLNHLSDAAETPAPHKIDVCHAPPGNIQNWQQLSIDINGLHGHENHQYDFIGSCQGGNNEQEVIYGVFDCQDDPNIAADNYRTQLATAVRNYYTPVIITHPVITSPPDNDADTANFAIINQQWDAVTEKVLSFFSDCKNTAKGDAKTLESADRTYWFVFGCKDLSVDYAYKSALEEEVSRNFSFNYHIIPDAALDMSQVKSAYDFCLNGHAEREILHYQGGDGFNFRVLTACPNSVAINSALDAYWNAVTANNGLPIILTANSLDDYHVTQAYAACCDAEKGGGNCIDPPSDKGFAGRLNWREVTKR